ncbi:MAG: hypothetical protein Q9183_006647 [Haloplaca sp. 2 TL-2023]
MFEFWSLAMKKALDEDPFWGPGLWKDFEARAKMLERGIEELPAFVSEASTGSAERSVTTWEGELDAGDCFGVLDDVVGGCEGGETGGFSRSGGDEADADEVFDVMTQRRLIFFTRLCL